VGHKRRRKPKRLAEKLLTIRLRLSLSQNQLAKLLEFEKGSARISEYEHGNREPDLVTLLIYANLARVSMDVLVNDDLELKFRKDWKAPS
jgi:transcriptional regulator with XRE-family HTH domain